MFIKTLKITSRTETIRELTFHSGLNLIIDETPSNDDKSTGNNVGKTTVLKLIDFCLGSNASIIYSDTENKKEVYGLVKDFLVTEEVLITLILVENLSDEASDEVVIERNFLAGKKNIRRINGKSILEKGF